MTSSLKAGERVNDMTKKCLLNLEHGGLADLSSLSGVMEMET